MESMQGLDAAFAALETNNAPVHVGSIIIYDPSTAPKGFVRFKDIMAFLENRLQLSKTLRQKMVKVPFGIDYPCWVQDKDFDIEYHVRHLSLPKPGDWRQLCIQAARIFSRPLDLTRPPWEITVIEGLDNLPGVPKGAYALLSKVHHVAIDGVSGVDLMQATHTLTADLSPLETPDTWKPEANPGQAEMLMRGLMRSSTLPFRQASALRKATPGLYRAFKGFVKRDFSLKSVLQTPRTRFNGVISSHRVFGAQVFKMKEVQQMRALAPSSTMNDVMLSIAGGAMRHYLESKSELPDQSLTAMAPISVRTESEKDSMGNQISGMYVPLGSHIASAEQRMKFVTSETIKAKKLTEALGARQMSDLAKLAPAQILNLGANAYHRLKLADRTPPLFSTVVTNVPGPPVPLYSAGAKTVAIYGMLCLMDGVRLGHIVHTYLSDVAFCFTACRDAVPDPDFYDSCISKSFDEHLAALTTKSAHPKSPSRKKKSVKSK